MCEFDNDEWLEPQKLSPDPLNAAIKELRELREGDVSKTQEAQDKKAWNEYKKIVDGLPTIKTYDPPRDTTADKCELLIACKCDKKYIVWVNREETEGIPKIMPDYKSLDVLCPHCNRHISERVLAATHSGGVFNAFDFG